MLLDAIKDRTRWIGILKELPIELRDVYFYPDYVGLNCSNKNSQAYLFVYKKNEKIWINPFIKVKTPIMPLPNIKPSTCPAILLSLVFT